MWWQLKTYSPALVGYSCPSSYLGGMIVALLLFSSTFVSAQRDSCQDNLSQANQLYEIGKLSQIIAILGDCPYDRDQSRSFRRTALNLSTEAYIFMDSTRLAQHTLLKLLQVDPFYKINAEIPEMRYLRQQVVSFPCAEISGSFGPILFTSAQFSSSTTVPGVTLISRKQSFKGVDGDYDIDWGFQGGVDIGIALYRHSNFDLHFGANVSRYSFRYLMQLENVESPNGEYDNASLFVAEKHLWLRAPVYLSLNLVPRDEIVNRHLIPYLKLGGSFDYLLSNTAKLTTLKLTYQSDSTVIVSPAQKIGDYRKSTTFSIIGGAGLKLHLHRLFFLMDAQYTYTLQNLRNTTNDPLTIQKFAYADNDFKLSNLSLHFGLGFFLFRARVR
jgi:hypothetical protein